jgi:hypothetical protein
VSLARSEFGFGRFARFVRVCRSNNGFRRPIVVSSAATIVSAEPRYSRGYAHGELGEQVVCACLVGAVFILIFFRTLG